MENLLLVFFHLFAVAFISASSHGIGCGHGHHGGHHHVGFASQGVYADGIKGQRDYGGFKGVLGGEHSGSLGGQAGYGGYRGGHQGSFGHQIDYSGFDSGYHRALGDHQVNVGVKGGHGRSPVAHQGNLDGYSGNSRDQAHGYQVSYRDQVGHGRSPIAHQGNLNDYSGSFGAGHGRSPIAQQGNLDGYSGSSADQAHGYQVGYRDQGGYQSSLPSQQGNLRGRDNLAVSTAGQQDPLGVHSIGLEGHGESRGGYKGGLGAGYQSTYGDHQSALPGQNSLGKSDGSPSKGGYGRTRSQSAYGGYDADHGGYGAHGGYIIQGY